MATAAARPRKKPLLPPPTVKQKRAIPAQKLKAERELLDLAAFCFAQAKKSDLDFAYASVLQAFEEAAKCTTEKQRRAIAGRLIAEIGAPEAGGPKWMAEGLKSKRLALGLRHEIDQREYQDSLMDHEREMATAGRRPG